MLDESHHILLLEDESAHAELVQRAFEMCAVPARLTVASSLAEARACLAALSTPPSLIIADWRLPDGEGLELLSDQQRAAAPVIIMTSQGNERIATEAFKAGALDYVVKSNETLDDMPHIAERAIREWNIIAERERIQAALRASEDRFRSLVQNAYDVITVVDHNGIISYESPSAARVLGYPADFLLGRTPFDFVHPDDLEHLQRALEETVAGEYDRPPVEFRFKHASGRWIYLESMSTNLLDQPAVGGIVITSRDISERHQAESALRQYNERLTILHEIDLAILSAKSIEEIADAALSRIQRAISLWRCQVILFDLEAGEAHVVVDYHAGQKIPADWRAPLSELGSLAALAPGEIRTLDDLTRQPLLPLFLHKMMQIGARASVNAPLIEPGRQIGLLSLHAGQPQAFSGETIQMVREVADQLAVAIQNANLLEKTRRHAQELELRVAERTRELAAANSQLTELDRLKSKFVSDVSHELRTPIANLNLHVELLERGRPEKRESYLTVVRQQAKRLGQLVDDILNLSRLEMSRQRAAFEWVDFNDLIDQIVTAHQPHAESANLALTFEPQPDLPAIVGEVNQLAQVVTNLVINALSYTLAGSVRVSTRGNGNEVCLTVEDTGIGIAADDVPHIFDRFYRGRRTQRRETPGTGLGLAIVKEIVDLHQGRIEVESGVRQGTTFKVWLPVFRPGYIS